ncbi:MAG TPA: efflux RND transporter permease subunit [Kiritimatiellia bacterium]|nr:efflux RND transporter permease subunit [Kiritimatiellia bacterium]
MGRNESILSGIVRAFLQGNLAPLLILVSLVAGAAALLLTPREEEPQIVVPLANIFISYPGGSAEEVEQLVASRLEKLLYQIDGVEYVYSMSRPGEAVVTVRFFVGEDREDSLIKLYNKVFSNIDHVTPGIAGWVVKPVEIDDVPILAAALYSERYTSHELYRIAEEIAQHLQRIPDSSRITLHGGERRTLQVYLDPERMAAHHLSPLELLRALQAANAQQSSGSYEQANRVLLVEAGPFLATAREVETLMVGVADGRPLYLRDVAHIVDGPEEHTSVSRIGFGPGSGIHAPELPAVTIAIAKKPGRNAVSVARDVEAMLDDLRANLLPHDLDILITRNYGETANEKVNNLVFSLGLAILTVIGLLALTMSWREGVIVALAVPITYALTLLFNYTMGYTINRVTLFALILTLGLLVDDPIVGVENIYRHIKMKGRADNDTILGAMNEVMPPIVLSTLAVMVSFFPMFFITGMMGPYMAPMAMNVPIAVLFSTLVALTITPTLARWILKTNATATDGPPPPPEDITVTPLYRAYRRLVGPFIASPAKSRLLLGGVGLLFAISVALALTGFVPLKMLPFDNKNELLFVIDLPESTTLETTDAAARDLEDYLRSLPEVVSFTTTVGEASPMDFNGLVRQYYLRQGPHLADIRVNLLHHTRRKADSHALVLRIRNDVAAIAQAHDAVIKIVETPPGPPVLASVVAEIYGSPSHRYQDLADAADLILDRMASEPGMVDLDSSVTAEQPKVHFRVDREKAGLHGITTADIVTSLHLALHGLQAGALHSRDDQNEIPILLRLPRHARSDLQRLERLPLRGPTGDLVPLGELGSFHHQTEDLVILRKNLERVVYVEAEMAGRGPAYAVLALQSYFKKNPLPDGIRVAWNGEGEWKITIDVFRDLGIAFAAALLGIYVLLVYQTASYSIPLVIMLSIPLTMIGIMPGFWLLNLLVNRPVGGFDNPVFFTATAMIGMIALSGIVVRNALVLIEFIRNAVAEGRDLDHAILESGAVRMRPILLTAGTTLLGAWPITLDPIFSGLAWSLIFGLFVSTAFTLVIVPVVFKLTMTRKET